MRSEIQIFNPPAERGSVLAKAIVILESETLSFRSPGVGAPPARYFTPRASASKARGTARVVRESTPPQDPKAPVPEQRRPIPADRAESPGRRERPAHGWP